eukprot:2277969-Alexandrium_andersonii.AAC.1
MQVRPATSLCTSPDVGCSRLKTASELACRCVQPPPSEPRPFVSCSRVHLPRCHCLRFEAPDLSNRGGARYSELLREDRRDARGPMPQSLMH